MAHLSEKAIKEIGFKHYGRNVKISDKASIYNAGNISIGDHTRIDDFCVLSAGEGGIEIGRNVHIAVFDSLIGKGRIFISDFANLSSRISIYSSNDDYSGKYMTNPTIPEQYTNVTYGDVFIGKHVIIGSGSIVLPNISIGQGTSIGALSLVNRNCDDFAIYAGIPIKKIGTKSKEHLELEVHYLNEKYGE